MKLCFLADFHAIHTLRWLRFFSERHEVHLISLEAPKWEMGPVKEGDYAPVGVKLHLVPRTGVNKLFGPRRVKKLIREIAPDVVHAHYVTHYGYLAAKSRFRPLVMTAWGSDVLIDVHQNFMKGHQVIYALKHADLLTSDGENTAKALRELTNGEKNYMKIYFGVDTKRFSPDRKVPGFFDKYLKEKNGKVVINLRGFTEVYDPGTFIRALPPVIEKFPGTVFVMARESDRRKVFEDMAASLKIDDSVKFVGNIPYDELPKYSASADIYVSNSLSDSGISASTAEAMACGLAVISTNIGDASYWIDEGKNGFLIEKGDSAALAEKMIRLISNDEMRRSFGREARKTIEERQDYYKEMGKMEQIYAALAKGSALPRF